MTNLNAATKIANDPQNNKSHWSEISLYEMKAFFGLVISNEHHKTASYRFILEKR